MDFLEVITLILVLNLDRNEGSTEADSKPIHLTEFIEKGEIIKARQLSLVTHDVIPKSHAGLITVDKQHGNHLFFWFFPAMNSDPQSPLLVWLNGGPGVSSMVGLFHENGPIRIESAEGENVTYKRREKSWSEKFNMLYIDQPVGVGYSYTEDEQGGYRVAQEGYSKDLYEFMEQFYVLFSEYKRRDLYIGGQSYAGKYVPAFAYHVHTKIMANTSSIPLKGIYLGGPLFDPETQCREAATLYEALGVLSKKETEDFVKKFDNFVSNGNYSHLKTQEYFDTIFPPVYMYYHDNYLTLETAPYAKISKIMTSEEVRKLIHVGNLSYESLSSDVNAKFRQDMMIGTKSKLAILMDKYKVCLFNGDLDGIVSSQMVDAGLMSMAWSRQAEYNSSKRQIWGLDTKPKGYYTKAGQFCRVVIRNAGHQVPYDQPETSLEMMEMFVQHGCVHN